MKGGHVRDTGRADFTELSCRSEVGYERGHQHLAQNFLAGMILGFRIRQS